MSTSDVIVVGGGIGGLSAAFALARQGLTVQVLEGAAAFGEVGAGLQLAPNCTRILDDFGILEAAKTLGVLPRAMVMRDALDGSELTRLDLVDLQRRYGFPYLVIHRSDLHALLLNACTAAGVDLVTDAEVVAYENIEAGARVRLKNGEERTAEVVIAADGLHSLARRLFVADEPVSSSYVAYRGTVSVADLGDRRVDLSEVVVYVGPRHHFVQYGLRGGDMLNQVAVFESPKATAEEMNWVTPDELDSAFSQSCSAVRAGIPAMWRDRWWRMYDRNPISTWVHGRVALLGDSAHPPLQYMAQGAIMAIEDAWVLAEHIARLRQTDETTDWDAALRAYEAVRPPHCRRVQTTARAWGALWHLDGVARAHRNVLLRARNTYDYAYTDWIYGPTALFPEDEPPMYPIVSLASSAESLERLKQANSDVGQS